MNPFDNIFSSFRKTLRVSKKKKSEKPNNINPFILEVTKKGIKLQNQDVSPFQTAIAKPINFIPRLLNHAHYRGKTIESILSGVIPAKNSLALSDGTPDLKYKASREWVAKFKDALQDNTQLKLLASLNIKWPEEIICSHCTEGVVPLCEECDGGYVTCENCGGNWHQACEDCAGEGQYPCDNCDGGRFRCDACVGVGQINCDHCDGKGEDTCGACDGKGCDECNDEDSSEGTIPCEDCDGDGTISCDNCDGDGDIECDNCGGEGHHYCEYCEGGQWYCQECDEGTYECDSCQGNWEEHNCPACGAQGKWNEENSKTFVELKELCKFPMEIEEKKSNLISGFSELLGESIYIPPKWNAKSYTKAIVKRNFIKSINWKVHYYDAGDLNFKNLNLNSLSLLIVPGPTQSVDIYTICSSTLSGDVDYPTLLYRMPIQGKITGYLPTLSYKNGVNQYGDYLNLSYLQSPAYAESKVIIMRSDWYYLIPPFLNWLGENPL